MALCTIPMVLSGNTTKFSGIALNIFPGVNVPAKTGLTAFKLSIFMLLALKTTLSSYFCNLPFSVKVTVNPPGIFSLGYSASFFLPDLLSGLLRYKVPVCPKAKCAPISFLPPFLKLSKGIKVIESILLSFTRKFSYSTSKSP